jgi:hypothetical protein
MKITLPRLAPQKSHDYAINPSGVRLWILTTGSRTSSLKKIQNLDLILGKGN